MAGKARVPAAILSALAVSVSVYAASGHAGSFGVATSAVSVASFSNVHYRLDEATPSRIDGITFSIRPALPDGDVAVQAAGHAYRCRLTRDGTRALCPTTTPPLTAQELTTLGIVAAN